MKTTPADSTPSKSKSQARKVARNAENMRQAEHNRDRMRELGYAPRDRVVEKSRRDSKGKVSAYSVTRAVRPSKLVRNELRLRSAIEQEARRSDAVKKITDSLGI